MTVLLPTTRVRSVQRRLQAAVGVSESPFTGTQQVQDWGGAWWVYSIDFAVITGREGQALSAFLAALKGPAGIFIFRDPSIRNTTGVGTPLVNGAGQTGNSLVTDGWSATGLKAGDFFSLGSGAAIRLYQVTADVVPAAGAATIQFTPALRSSPADNAALNVATPEVLLRLLGPAPAQVQGADKYQFSIEAREAI